jgi:hypothetical protein
MARDNTLNWQTIDVSTLSPAARKQYDVMRKARTIAAVEREKFEAAARAGKANAHEIVFSYNFGRLSAARDVTRKPGDAKAKAEPKATALDDL